MSKDDIEIQAAIDYMAGQGGGLVQLTEGTFYIDTAIVLKNNITLQGRGASTIIQQETSTADIIRMVGTAGALVHDCTVRNILLQRTTASTLTNSYSSIYCDYVKNVMVEGCNGNYNTGEFIKITNSESCQIVNNNMANGAYLRASVKVDSSKNVLIDGNILVSCGNGIGVGTLTGDVIITNNLIDNMYATGGTGIYVSSTKATISNNRMEKINYNGIFLYGSSDSIVVGNKILSTGSHALWVRNSSNYNVISGNNVQYSTSIGIYIESGTKNIVTSNISLNNGTNFTDTGTSTTTGNNIFA